MAESGRVVIALRVTRRPGATEPDATALVLPAEGLIIGRSDDCGLVLADPLRLVSRQHAQVLVNGQSARVRCVSSKPLWVNDVQLDPGGEQALVAGDRLRIGRFELAVEPAEEPAAATAAQRPRLDRWFDLDGAPDPLAAESPLPALAASPEAPATSAVVSWQTSGHLVRGGAPIASSAAAMPPAPPPPQAAPVPAETPRPSPASRPAPAENPPAQRATRRSTKASPELTELAAAFARGAGLGAEAAPLTPEWMEHLGALLRATAEGTLALLQSRAVAKRHMRAEGTHITPRENNPLKFSPDANEALTRMLQRDASPGFLDPVAALRDAHHDLLVHQVAMVAGMRAAVFELFSRLGPEAAENAQGPAQGMARLPLLRAAALWKRHCMQHAQLLEHLDDDFETIFGREFLRAYEAQSRADAKADAAADPTPPEAPWPGAH
ncbi:type VI secretion system-associated FHA domain protein TagH [Caenimonas soli]|uniref:type VI secretion system-associated FHA domain protein TagH n=1 Tax=Caenimonas soli TaxID=2735555 RepID=UPI001554F3CC|nr:type VI secretion system-associated FHA domain protein TagH [Caenimonas soli]NPC56504.1 type VI secretion system-associated FHA domain protein TagH [Caenimonas soli]